MLWVKILSERIEPVFKSNLFCITVYGMRFDLKRRMIMEAMKERLILIKHVLLVCMSTNLQS